MAKPLKKPADSDTGAITEALVAEVYGELRRLAAHYMRSENAGHTLQPTALVNEAFVRLAGQHDVKWQNKSHFLGVAAQMMRRVLVDYAKARKAEKRGGGAVKLSFDEALHANSSDHEILNVDDALTRLAAIEPKQAQVVELRYFGGLTLEEIAEVVGTSVATVRRQWEIARAWLYRELSKEKRDR